MDQIQKFIETTIAYYNGDYSKQRLEDIKSNVAITISNLNEEDGEPNGR